MKEDFDREFESNLMLRLTRGDHDAFRILFDTYWLLLYKYARPKLESDEDAKELVQNVFLDLWEKRARFEIRNVEHYLKVCVRNRCIDIIRARVHKNKYAEYFREFEHTAANATEETVKFRELTAHLDEALRTLPEKSRQVFQLSKMEGFSVNEISQKVNLSTKAVEYHLTKANKIVRMSLKDFV